MMESAEHAFLRSVGLSVMQPTADGSHLTWPRVATQCDYQSAARFEEMLEIAVSVEHLGNKSVRYRFEFTCENRAVATGTITAVCCLLKAGRLESVAIPDAVREQLAPLAG